MEKTRSVVRIARRVSTMSRKFSTWPEENELVEKVSIKTLDMSDDMAEFAIICVGMVSI